jgi:tripartite-type tricarboxylate transporter receptor subunit TctC
LNLPDIEAFAKSEKEKKLLNMVRAFRSIGTALLLPPGTPKDRVEIFKEAVRKTHTDPEFINEYRKLTSEPTPLMLDEQAKIVKEIPRDRL